MSAGVIGAIEEFGVAGRLRTPGAQEIFYRVVMEYEYDHEKDGHVPGSVSSAGFTQIEPDAVIYESALRNELGTRAWCTNVKINRVAVLKFESVCEITIAKEGSSL